MSGLFGFSRGSRNKRARATAENVISSSARFSSGFKQVSGRSKTILTAKNPHDVFKLEETFERRGTVYGKIRKLFIGSIIVMSASVFIRFVLIPKSFYDPNAPVRMDHHSFKRIMFHLTPAMVFLFGAFFQKESVSIVANNSKFIKYHRYVGRITTLASLVASICAWPVSLNAIHGTQVVYVPWNAFWNYATLKTVYHVWKKEYWQHRLWANCLVHTAFLFVTSRLGLIVGFALGLPSGFVYVVAIFSAAFLAFTWYLLESGQYERTVAAHKRWAKIRTFVHVFFRFVKKTDENMKLLKNMSSMVLSDRDKELFVKNLRGPAKSKDRICLTCVTKIESDAMKCDNPHCKGFNDSAQGEYTQLMIDTCRSLATMPFSIAIQRVFSAPIRIKGTELFSCLAMPFLIIYFWMGLPLLNAEGDLSFSGLIGWHFAYTFVCVHMAASLYECTPIEWIPHANPKGHISSIFWNSVASISGIIDAGFLHFCRSNDLWIDRNPTWLVSLVVGFLPVFLLPYFYSDKNAPRRFIRTLYAVATILLPFAGYLTATFTAYLCTSYLNNDSVQYILGMMVALQLTEEVLNEVSQATIDASKREFGLDDDSLPASKRSKEQQLAVENFEYLFSFQNFMFGAYFLCFYRELWTSITSTLVCLVAQTIMLLQDFNMLFGSTVLRSVRVIIEGPVLSHQINPRESLVKPTDRRDKKLFDEFNIRISRKELMGSFRTLSFKLLIRLITMAATPFFGIMCRFGPNAAAYPTWSNMDIITFLIVMKNFLFMFVLEGLFVVAIVASIYQYFRINLVQILTTSLLRSHSTQVLFIASTIHLLQDLYVAIISLEGLQ